jgi:uncharacterized protein YjiK
MTFSLFAGLLLLLSGCGTKSDQEATDPVFPPFDFEYDLKEPDATFEMDKDLKEISGLSLTADGRYFVAIQDEDGTVFFINKNNGEIEREIDFWKDGDYEGVEVAGEEIFVVKSSGTLYRIGDVTKAHLSVDKYNQTLGNKNNVEGLAYDAANNRLLLACKGDAGDGATYRFKKAIYAFNLATMLMDTSPVYLISLEDVQAYLGTSPPIRKLQKLLDDFSLEESDFIFGPSGIAIHPITGHYYITSSIGKLLMVLDPSGAILHIEKLDDDVHPQPEGICFDTDGTLYIANEGKGDDGVIHRFRFRGIGNKPARSE